MNPWQQQNGPYSGPPPTGAPQQQPYPAGPYPQQPYPPQYHPQAGYRYPGYQQPYPGYPYPPYRPASSGTAITAIVLSMLTALFQGFACIGYVAVAAELTQAGDAAREWVPGFLIFEGIARLFAAAALVAGAVLMIRRHPTGRWVTAGGAIAVLILQVLEYGVRSSILSTSGASPLSSLSSVILPIILVVVALTASTRRWLGEGRQTLR
ncbi:hypothetical protein [Mycolicibacterium baixiangningiae]|uniref:hypothetical protein n=1 Tax=Mycolicibacterium baixiangningiae TaxID=2761578 RepID=UPI0018D13EFC|nr:hypothetical protein [Mycolicibacterium baixiangningiae]